MNKLFNINCFYSWFGIKDLDDKDIILVGLLKEQSHDPGSGMQNVVTFTSQEYRRYESHFCNKSH